MPRMSAGKLDTVLACPRRLAAALAGDGITMRSSDGPFRLGNALADAIRAAWLDETVRPLRIDPTPPPGLSLEEQHRFRTAVDAYGDVAGERDLRLDLRSGDVLTAPSADGSFLISGRPDLLLERRDGDLELHRVVAAPGPARTPTGPATSDVTVAALVRRGRPATVRVHVLRVWTEPPALCVEHVVDSDQVDALRARLRSAVDVAAVSPEPRPGWCCRDCPVLRDCDAVPSLPIEQIVRRP